MSGLRTKFNLNYKKIFLIIVIVAIFVRLFVTFGVPDSAFSDSFVHLTFGEYIIKNGEVPLPESWNAETAVNPIPMGAIVATPPPFYYSFISNFLITSFVSINKFFL